jgi:tRNA(His) 5'-end guanylyltransferase
METTSDIHKSANWGLKEVQIKLKESEYRRYFQPELHTIIRIDGHGFSKFTRSFEKPCDAKLESAMIETCKDLLKEFQAITLYTQSDEITMVIPATAQDPVTKIHYPMIYGGRQSKLESLSASFAAARFNHHLQSICQPDQPIKTAYFDARAFQVLDESEVMLVIDWRRKYDCWRNGVSAIAQKYFSHSQLMHKSTIDKLAMLEEKQIHLNQYPKHLLYGTFIKKKKVDMVATDYVTQTQQPCVRHQIVTFNGDTELTTEQIMAKSL